MTEKTIRERFDAVMNKMGVAKDDIRDTASLVEDLGLDSLDKVDLLFHLETEFDIAIPDDRADAIGNVGAAIEEVERLMAEPKPTPDDTYQMALDLGLAVRDSRSWTVSQETVMRLMDEVHFWRAEAAARLMHARAAYQGAGSDARRAEIYVALVQPTVSGLEAALSGDLHPICEPCGQPIFNGQAIITFEDIGDAHADCHEHSLKPGTEIPVSPDEMSEEFKAHMAAAGQPLPTHTTVRAYEELISEQRVVEILAETQAALAQREAA